MAKKFGKRPKGGQQAPGPQQDPRAMFGAPPPLPRQAGNPASSSPLADHLARGWPGVDSNYVVLPRSLAESMSLPWQQQLVNLLGQFHQAHGALSWPAYRVVPSRHERLADLDEDQLAEAGYLVEIDSDGEMVYRERNGRKVDDPQQTVVLVPCLDPIARENTPAQPEHAPAPPEQPPPAATWEPAPMNVGPQPVWPTSRPTATGTSAAEQDSREVAEPETPARGFAAPTTTEPATPSEPPTQGWFDELPAQPEEQQAKCAGESADFGPTGEPTEIPYRYHR